MFCNIFCSLKFKLNVFLQTPDPRDSVDMSYEIPEQQDQPQRAGAAAQDPDPGQGPQALHSPPGQLDLLAPSSPSIRSCRLQPKLLQGNICYIFHNIFFINCHISIQAAVLFLYNDNIQAPEVPGPAQAASGRVTDVTSGLCPICNRKTVGFFFIKIHLYLSPVLAVNPGPSLQSSECGGVYLEY